LLPKILFRELGIPSASLRDALAFAQGKWELGIGEWGMGNGELGMGHWAWGLTFPSSEGDALNKVTIKKGVNT
jgi:hypothetical protein